jgi:hypothetical protein
VGIRLRIAGRSTADELAAVVEWKMPLSELRGKPVRLEISLKNANLFALETR